MRTHVGPTSFWPFQDVSRVAAEKRPDPDQKALLRIRGGLDAWLLACILAERATPTVALSESHVQELVRTVNAVDDATLRAWTERVPPDEQAARWHRAVSLSQRSYPNLSGARELPLNLPTQRSPSGRGGQTASVARLQHTASAQDHDRLAGECRP